MSVTLALTGQCAVHGPLDRTPSSAVVDLLAADMALANLEATVAVAGAWPTKPKTLHLADAEALQSLGQLGLTAVAHANNHAFDLGPPGIAATHAAARAAKLTIAGSGADLAAAAAPALMSTAAGPELALFAVDCGPQPAIVYAAPARAGIHGLRLERVVALPPGHLVALRAIAADLGDDARAAARRRAGYDAAVADDTLSLFGTSFVAGPAVAPLWRVDAGDRARLVAAIAAEKAAGRVVVVALHCHHWDADWHATPLWFEALAGDLIAAGADVIAGTGAPVLQPARMIAGRPVFSGLGNAVFHTGRAARYDTEKLDVWRGVTLRLTLADDGALIDAAVLPIAVGRPEPGPRGLPLGPTPLAAPDAGALFDRLLAPLPPDARARWRRV